MINDSSAGRVSDRVRAIMAGLVPGSRLPSTRALAARFGVGPVTVQRAIARLVAEGLVETRPGVGNFTRAPRPVVAADHGWQTAALGVPRAAAAVGSTMRSSADGVISLRESYPCEELLPARALRAALARAARGPGVVERPPPSGMPQLRSWFADELGALTMAGGVAPGRSDVLVVPGGQSALASIFRALAAPGEAVVMESPTYWGAIAAARQAGLRIVPVARVGTAVTPDALERALRAGPARLFYAQPHFANPSGSRWSADDADATLAVLRAHDAFLVEDDWAHDLGFGAPVVPVASRDADGHVIYVRSLTKSMSPALRVAAVIARGPARARIETDRTINDLYVSGVLQRAALEVLASPGRPGQLRAAHQALRARRDALLEQLRRWAPGLTLPVMPEGGLNLWMRLPGERSAGEVAARCELAGLAVSPGDEWFPGEPAGAFLRLNFSGPEPERFAEAARILGGVLG